MICGNCPHACNLTESSVGRCKARTVRDGRIVSLNYAQSTALAVDPIEKKPLRRFMPGTRILSVSSWGCNMHCPWCQNDMISRGPATYKTITPVELAAQAESAPENVIGVAYTYNEPLIGPEFLLESARLVKEAGRRNVLVSNGMASPYVFDAVLTYLDACNIDLKTSDPGKYRSIGGDADTIRRNIREAAKRIHVELTTLVVPGWNDTEEEMRQIAGWIAQIDPEIPLHVSRCYPAGEWWYIQPTPVDTVYRLADVARQYLKYVYEGNC